MKLKECPYCGGPMDIMTISLLRPEYFVTLICHGCFRVFERDIKEDFDPFGSLRNACVHAWNSTWEKKDDSK